MNGDGNLTKDNWSEPMLYILDVKQTLDGQPDEPDEDFEGKINVISDY